MISILFDARTCNVKKHRKALHSCFDVLIVMCNGVTVEV